ncbi:MAG: GIY-YIG nuclease family protein [Desulfotomaculaceae bacterium]|nr:GIY-YIG nuclease family protein [Desulfotomaculaceae bacterium]
MVNPNIRKKELKMQYKQMKQDMGIFIIRSKANNKCFLKATPDLRGVINGTRVRLGGGVHPYRELQKEWDEFGPDNFTIEILENLEYDKDESKTDYSEELEVLQMLWEEKLAGEDLQFYKKRI